MQTSLAVEHGFGGEDETSQHLTLLFTQTGSIFFVFSPLSGCRGNRRDQKICYIFWKFSKESCRETPSDGTSNHNLQRISSQELNPSSFPDNHLHGWGFKHPWRFWGSRFKGWNSESHWVMTLHMNTQLSIVDRRKKKSLFV